MTIAAPVAIATWSSAAPPAGCPAATKFIACTYPCAGECNTISWHICRCTISDVTDVTRELASEDGTARTAEMTIDEVARRTGMTVRNIRAHQSRGLVPPPEVRGRTGYYGDEHLARIELSKELQADGFNLEAIRRLLESARGSSSEVLDFSRKLRAGFEDEEPEILTEEEMAERWGGPLDPELMARSERLGLLHMLGDGRIEILSPRLQRAGVELAR